MARLLAVDANSLTHRGFHSVLRDVGDVTRIDVAEVCSAVLTMIASTWQYGPYDRLVLAFDHPRNQRRDDYPEYKGQRKPTPAPVKAALAEVNRLFTDAGTCVLRRDGAEADDLLAAVIDVTEPNQLDSDVLSSDRDLLALVDTHTRLLRPQHSFAQLIVETPETVYDRYGIAPWQYTELAALRGDPSDGLDGVRGVGEKTAAKLIRRYETVLGVYAHLDVLTPRLEAALRRDRDAVERNLLLMTPRTHLNVSRDEILDSAVEPNRLIETFEAAGLSDASRRFQRAVTASPRPPRAPAPNAPFAT